MVTRYTVNGKTMDMTQTAQIIHYHVNMAAYIEHGNWFDYLRENGVYDNTRIILVSDHGYGAGHFNIKYHDGRATNIPARAGIYSAFPSK